MNTIFTMMMGEVNLDFIASSTNTTSSPFVKEFWIETPVTANIVFFTFCCSVSIVVFNILTAFAIKVLQNIRMPFLINQRTIY